jgi:hypothetical protein
LVIPGHGRVTNEFEVAEYRDMLVIFRDRIQANDQKRRNVGAGQGGAANGGL